MVKVNIYGPEGQIVESTDLEEQPNYNNPNCQHKHAREVEDPMEGVTAYQCPECNVGWLVRNTDKIKEESS